MNFCVYSFPEQKFPQLTAPVEKNLLTKGLCYFLVSEQESNQRTQLKEALKAALPRVPAALLKNPPGTRYMGS